MSDWFVSLKDFDFDEEDEISPDFSEQDELDEIGLIDSILMHCNERDLICPICFEALVFERDELDWFCPHCDSIESRNEWRDASDHWC